MTYYYCILHINQITQDMIDEAVTTAESMRMSVNDQYGLLKFVSKFPNSMVGLKKYNQNEIDAIMDTEVWTAA